MNKYEKAMAEINKKLTELIEAHIIEYGTSGINIGKGSNISIDIDIQHIGSVTAYNYNEPIQIGSIMHTALSIKVTPIMATIIQAAIDSANRQEPESNNQ